MGVGLTTRTQATVVLCMASWLLTGCTAEMKARAYAGDDRDAWQQADRVIAELHLAPGQKVADIGSGGGYFTFRLAEAVGSEGVVYAVDVDADMNERLAGIAMERGASNVHIVLAAFDDPRIPQPVDLIFTSNTYHHLEDRVAYLEKAARYIAPGGRIAVVEYRRKGFFQRFLGHATEADEIRSEFESAGYALVADHDFLDRQHFLVFRRPGEGG